jgi:nanoRNase/pAp phosphatase (c-di-AMP/oligoRNAs hydrolase)
MDQQQLDFTSVQEALTKAKNVLVLMPANPHLDKVAASLALYLSLKKQGKQVVIACPSAMTVGFNRLFAIDKVSDKIGNRNLIISFDYQKDSIEKVSYHIEDNKFNLVVEPQVGKPPLAVDKVAYSYAGTEADLIFVIGAPKLEDLDRLYFNEKKTFEKSSVINIDDDPGNTKFGRINLLDAQAASCCEIITQLMKGLNLPVDQDMATNLLAGIESRTSNFQSPKTSVASFEAAAWCLKKGAKRGNRPMSVSQPASIQPPFLTPKAPLEEEASHQPPPDWFKPKIYKGNTLI